MELLEGELGFRLEENKDEPKITKLADRGHFLGFTTQNKKGKLL